MTGPSRYAEEFATGESSIAIDTEALPNGAATPSAAQLAQFERAAEYREILRKTYLFLRFPYNDIVEEALAVGWVDNQRRELDEDRSQLLVSPRKPGSNWSRLNKERIARLTGAGLMRDAGRAVVAAACADGSWHASTT